MAMMKAAFYDGKGKMNVGEYPKPEVGPGGVLVNIRATGICGSDLQMKADQTEEDKGPVGSDVLRPWSALQLNQPCSVLHEPGLHGPGSEEIGGPPLIG